MAALEKALMVQVQVGSQEAISQPMQLQTLRHMQKASRGGGGGRDGDDSEDSDAQNPRRKGGLNAVTLMRHTFREKPDQITEV